MLERVDVRDRVLLTEKIVVTESETEFWDILSETLCQTQGCDRDTLIQARDIAVKSKINNVFQKESNSFQMN